MERLDWFESIVLDVSYDYLLASISLSVPSFRFSTTSNTPRIFSWRPTSVSRSACLSRQVHILSGARRVEFSPIVVHQLASLMLRLLDHVHRLRGNIIATLRSSSQRARGSYVYPKSYYINRRDCTPMLELFLGAGKTGYNPIKAATHYILHSLSPTLYKVH
jgi:hypothetical protein